MRKEKYTTKKRTSNKSLKDVAGGRAREAQLKPKTSKGKASQTLGNKPSGSTPKGEAELNIKGILSRKVGGLTKRK